MADDPNTDSYIRTEVPHWCGIEIWQSQDLYEAVPQMIDGETGEPLNLDAFASLRFDLFIRSEFEYPTEIAFLTTGDGIVFDDRANGLISIQRDRSIVNTWPIGEWVQWLNMVWTETGSEVIKTLWRGPFIIHPGKTV
jgi:hypothetical protein